jgi:chemotaxis protein MotB
MERLNTQQEPDEAAGAPEWMVTFSDCMTLLLTFFVLLLSFSSFDERIFQQLRNIFADSLPAVSPKTKKDKDAVSSTRQIQATTDLSQGSEKPTLETGAENVSKQDTEPVDFHSRKVFLISSDRIFWGRGSAISPKGRKVMTIMASFLKNVPGPVVISENGMPNDKDNKYSGLPRAWSVMEYFISKQNLDKNRFSISATSTLPQRALKSGNLSFSTSQEERMLEIVLLERSIYN